MCAVLTKFAGLAVYLTFVSGLGALCLNLSSHVAAHAVVLTTPYLMAKTERMPTLVERREAAAAAGAPAELVAEAKFIPDPPTIPLTVLAAQMDVSEKADLAKVTRGTRRVAKANPHRVHRQARMAAADVFGRSFGVMLMASR